MRLASREPSHDPPKLSAHDFHLSTQQHEEVYSFSPQQTGKLLSFARTLIGEMVRSRQGSARDLSGQLCSSPQSWFSAKDVEPEILEQSLVDTCPHPIVVIGCHQYHAQ
jgi:hypothetical protein